MASSSQIPPIEIGSLTTSSTQESQFIGSSSGIFFINTVYRAFAKSKDGMARYNLDEGRQSVDQASVDDCILNSEHGNESSHRATPTSQLYHSHEGNSLGLGLPPSQNLATELLRVYFERWHPLFPFLHGPTFLRDIESFYAGEFDAPVEAHSDIRRRTCRILIFQSIFNVAALGTDGLILPHESRIESATAILSISGTIACHHDVLSLQALLTAQLYLIATMSLRAASTIGGILLRLLFHGGFHRCPFRYPQLSQHDCTIRKRIFWTVYVTDRYLSQTLGHPLGIQDSDIDVCVPGTRELHRPVLRVANNMSPPTAEQDVLAHLPQAHQDEELISPESDLQNLEAVPGSSHVTVSPPSDPTQHGEDILTYYVGYCQITGQVLELFHKSLHSRYVDHNNTLVLTSKVHAWWNGLPQKLQVLSSRPTSDSDGTFALFFIILYQQLIILINRPFLSLSPSKPGFNLSLQTCIGASRIIILTLKDFAEQGQHCSWPGILSGTWMSGLVLAFACELHLYSFNKGVSEIELCLEHLQKMGTKWSTARHCQAVLSILLSDLRLRISKRSSDSLASHLAETPRKSELSQHRTAQALSTRHRDEANINKRRRIINMSYTSPSNSKDRNSTGNSQLQDTLQPQFGNFQLCQTSSLPVSAIGVNPTSTSPEHITQESQNILEQGQNEPEWLRDPMNEGVYPDINDIFRQVSWEALFEGGDEADFSGWDDKIL